MEYQLNNIHDDENLLITFFANPAVGILGSIASIIGVILAIFFYYNGHASRELDYKFVGFNELYSSGHSSQISVLHDDKLITDNINIVTIRVFNNGKLSIKPTHILEPFTFTLDKSGRILGAKIISQNREVVDAKIEQFEKKVIFDWKILEQGDEFTFQIIYKSCKDIQLLCSAIIEGQQDINGSLLEVNLSKIIRVFFQKKKLT